VETQVNSMILFVTKGKQRDHISRKWASNMIISRVTSKQHDQILKHQANVIKSGTTRQTV
jgi:hypothetical protein